MKKAVIWYFKELWVLPQDFLLFLFVPLLAVTWAETPKDGVAQATIYILSLPLLKVLAKKIGF